MTLADIQPTRVLDGNALVYCPDAFNTTNGKTAHGLVRFTERYRVLAVIDPAWAGRDAGDVLDGKPCGIPVIASLDEAMERFTGEGDRPSHLVVGLAPDGGRLPASARTDLVRALEAGLHMDSGLHDYLGEDPDMAGAAAASGAVIRDIRRPPERRNLHFFSGKIEEVDSFTIALLGTDSAVGKRTTAWILVHALRAAGRRAELVGTGQTAWLQGAPYGVIMDSLVNDFVAGEIEHAVHEAWRNTRPDVLVIEGQGSLMNPAYPGGFEILAAGRPDIVVLQHASRRKDYDGFPGYPIHPLPVQIQAVELLSGKPVVAITLNHEDLTREEIPAECERVAAEAGRPCFDVLALGADGLVETLNGFREPNMPRVGTAQA